MENQTIVVIGGSAGIGLEVAKIAQSRGAHVVALGRDKAKLALAKTEAPGIEFRQGDAIDHKSIEIALADLSKINHIYVAAGTFIGGGFADIDIETAKAALDARIWGAIATAKLAQHRMPPGGSLTLTSGVSTDRPVKGAWATALATAAAEQLARALALELAPIRVNAVAPGWTDTPMWNPILGDAKAAAFADVAEKLPIGRIAKAEEVADAVLFLMNNASMTGEIVHVDGGHRLT
jgi:NAD(P)-dependent dehydrogenase (short-subunit alcohol dehydrogenase family)